MIQCNIMGFLSNFKKDLQAAKKEKTAQINGKNLEVLLKKFKEERDRIEKETGIRPQIDETTQMFMLKILNVWIAEGKKLMKKNSGQKLIIIDSLPIRLNIMRLTPRCKLICFLSIFFVLPDPFLSQTYLKNQVLSKCIGKYR